ncbi:MAG: hypothetical protein NVS2B16_36100 [Chloroflexota bacterium]
MPQARYDGRRHLRRDLDEVTPAQTREVAPGRTDDGFPAVVVRRQRGVSHTTRDAYKQVVARVTHIARQKGRDTALRASP